MKAKFKIFTTILLVFLFGSIVAQQVSFDFCEESITERLQEDVSTLASDEMEGREAGTPGEEKAVEYIKERFEETGVEPLFGDSYFQYFDFHGAWQYAEDNTLQINETEYLPGECFFPMVQSGDASALGKPVYLEYGYVNDTLGWNDYDSRKNLEDKIFVMEYYLPDSLYEKLDITVDEALQSRIETAVEYGSGGVLFVNSLRPMNDPTISMRRSAHRWDIPVTFGCFEIYELLSEAEFNYEVNLSVELMREIYTGINVAAYIDNDSETTVVIGAHHDHLGYGGPTSRHEGEQEIHPGADDNASGVAGVLETARYISEKGWTGNNYLFITFSAEEKGLLGSRHFTESKAYDMEKVNYMFNLDMIGRMEENNLVLIGTGTSPTWESLIAERQPEDLNVRTVASGVGGSDHTSFYLKDIPVIFFFTGIHGDYHEPGDVHEKINYDGQQKVLKFAWDMMKKLDIEDRLEFTETPVETSHRRRARGVSMGIMPDHAFDGTGLKVQKVIEGRPAHEGGLIDGDIIVTLGDVEVKEIHSYMRALQDIKEGDVITVVLLRDGEEVEVEVEF